MDVLSLLIDLALDLHESSCFDYRSQRLTQLIGSVLIKYFVVSDRRSREFVCISVLTRNV